MTKLDTFGPVARALVGDNSPSVRSGDDPALYGSASLTPLDPVETRSFPDVQTDVHRRQARH